MKKLYSIDLVQPFVNCTMLVGEASHKAGSSSWLVSGVTLVQILLELDLMLKNSRPLIDHNRIVSLAYKVHVID